jgi:predicted transcriptional regulator
MFEILAGAMTMAKTAVVKARVDAAMLVALDEVVAASVGDRSDHVRKAVEEYVRRYGRRGDGLAIGVDDDGVGMDTVVCAGEV